MKTPIVMIARLAALASVATAVVLGVRLSQRRTELREARVSAESLAATLSEIATLIPREQTAITQAPPENAVTTELLAALERSGIPAESLVQETTGAEEPVVFENQQAQRGVSYARRSVSLTLAPLSLADLGAFITDWKGHQPVWVISKIDLNHTGDQNAATYTAALRLTATYLVAKPTAASGSQSRIDSPTARTRVPASNQTRSFDTMHTSDRAQALNHTSASNQRATGAPQ